MYMCIYLLRFVFIPTTTPNFNLTTQTAMICDRKFNSLSPERWKMATTSDT